MTARRTAVILMLAATLMLAGSAAIVLSVTPWDALLKDFARAPRITWLYLNYWLTGPVSCVVVFIAYFAALKVWRPKSPSQGRFLQVLMIGLGVLAGAIMTVHIVGLFVDRAQRAAFVAAGGAPSAFHFDPQLVITRIGMVAGGLFVAWAGNRMPKVVVPEGTSRQDRLAGARRIQGWTFLVAGLAMSASAFLSPIVRGFYAYGAIALSAYVVVLVARAAYRFGPPPAPTGSAS